MSTAHFGQLDANNLQDVLDSAANAASKGRAQYFTPLPLAEALATALPHSRQCVVDLTMGNGALLIGSGAFKALGLDIDSRLARKPAKAQGEWTCITADLTKAYPLMAEANWQADLFTLNPPFSLQWYRDRLAALAESECEAVREEFARHKSPTIDSTLATLLIALDRCTARGEGYLICNANTAKRLFDQSPLKRHIWLWLTLPEGIFENIALDFPTAILYFARSHNSHSSQNSHDSQEPFLLDCPSAEPAVIRSYLGNIIRQRYILRRGVSISSSVEFNPDTAPILRAIGHEIQRSARPASDFNIWLGIDGTIQRHLTPFQHCSRRIPKEKAKRLNDLQGRTPMALVVQRHTRIALIEAIHSDLWRVDPKLVAAVDKACKDYNANRAPFYPLNDVQRLGYLDESETIVCRKSFGTDKDGNGPIFLAGNSYPITCSTETIERSEQRTNLAGESEDVTLSGQELAITVTVDSDKNKDKGYTFRPIYPEKKLLARKIAHRYADQYQITLSDNTTHWASGQTPEEAAAKCIEQVKLNREKYNAASTNRMFELKPLDLLLEHFVIPQVPDVAETDPERYQHFKQAILDLEKQIVARGAKPFRKYQVDDLARAAMHDGCVFSWDPGLGKTRATFTFPIIQGSKRNLIVAPESLHLQIINEGRDVFGVTTKQLLTIDDFHADKDLQEANRQRLAGDPITVEGWWITSYSALGYNGGDKWATKEKENGEEIVNKVILARRQSHPHYNEKLDFGIGDTDRNIRCLFYPTLSTLTADLFDHVLCDEAVRIKSNDSHIGLGVREMRPRFRHPLTATPIKNHLDDIFWLCHWSAGGTDEPTARWPYANSFSAKEDFANEHMIIEQNHTKEARLAEQEKYRKIVKRTSQICNIHRLWKLLAPIVVRRRKDDVGEDIVPKTIVPIIVNPGHAQKVVYQFHATHAPEYNKNGQEMSKIAKVVAQLQNLRQAALCPDSANLGAGGLSPHTLRRIVMEHWQPTSGPIDDKRTEKALLVARKGAATPFPAEAEAAFALVESMVDKGQIDLAKIIKAVPVLEEKLRKEIDASKSSRSWTDHNPKQAALLKLICDLIATGEQVVVMSPFQAFSQTLHNRLTQAGVSACLLDGNISPRKRGIIAGEFKRKKYAVLIGGQKSMGEGHSFECASHLILPSIDWAFDINAQSIDRVHRLNSTKPVTIYLMITAASIDQRLESLFREKGDSAQLALDGRLFADHTEELNLGDLLREAVRNFDPKAPTISEASIEQEWDSLKAKLRHAEHAYREFHPEITATINDHGRPEKVTRSEVATAVKAAAPIIAASTPLTNTVRNIPMGMWQILLETKEPTLLQTVRETFLQYCASNPRFTDWRIAWKAFQPQLQTLTKPKPEPAQLPAPKPAPKPPLTAAEAAARFLMGL